MRKVELRLNGVSEIVGSDQLGILLLTDLEQQRQLSIVCEKTMAVQIELHCKQMPMTEMMLPEVLCRLIKESLHTELEITITSLVAGQYKALLYDKNSADSFQIRASDAVLLHVAGHVPLFIDETLMDRQSVSCHSSQMKGIHIPINTLSDDMLKNALHKAVLEENYEMASKLRDELRRRNLENL